MSEAFRFLNEHGDLRVATEEILMRGVLFGSDQLASSSGKLFVPDLTPRTIYETVVGTAKQFNNLFDESTKTLRDALEQSQLRLSSFQRDKGIVASA